jgi:hypothetical protein
VAYADPQYVSDKLVVNVYAEADQESSKVATLDSGDAVEGIEKVDTYTHVRLADSREGWIKSSYLTVQKPAVVRLKELEKERGASAAAPSSAQLAQLGAELKQVKEQNAELQTELTAAKQKAQSPAPVATESPPPKRKAEPVMPDQTPADKIDGVTWIAAAGVLCGSIGFGLGYQMLARKIRRKYGSVRIY